MIHTGTAVHCPAEDPRIFRPEDELERDECMATKIAWDSKNGYNTQGHIPAASHWPRKMTRDKKGKIKYLSEPIYTTSSDQCDALAWECFWESRALLDMSKQSV